MSCMRVSPMCSKVRTHVDSDSPRDSALALHEANSTGVIRTSSLAVRSFVLVLIVLCPQWEQKASAVKGESFALQPSVYAVEFPHVFVEHRPVAGPVGCSHGDNQLCRASSQFEAWWQSVPVVALLERPEPCGWTGATTAATTRLNVSVSPPSLAVEETEIFSQSSHTELSVRHSAVQGKRYG